MTFLIMTVKNCLLACIWRQGQFFLFHRKALVRLKWKSKDLLDRHADQRYDKTVINHGKDMAAICLIYQSLNAKINTDKMFLLSLKKIQYL